jgi:MFS family permease
MRSLDEGRLAYPGWLVVTGAFLALFVAFGSLYAFAAFFTELERDFAADRAAVSLVFGIGGFLFFAVGALSGPLADRFGPRRVVIAGIGSIAAGLILASRSQTLLGVYLAYGVGLGVGVGFVYVPAVGAVQRWFVQRRGLASGFAVSGIGAGTLAMPLLAALLIGPLGWRGTFVAFGLIVLVTGLAAAVLLDLKRGRAHLPAGDTTAGAAERGGLAQALRSRPFWLLYLAGWLSSFGIYTAFVHLAPYAVDQGLPETFGVTLVGLIGLSSVVGRFLFGGAADRIGRRWGTALMFAGMGAMLFVWLTSEGAVGLVIFALLFGAFYGGFVALVPALTADYFGGARVSGIIGFLYTGAAFGALLGPTASGWVFDVSGSYALPIAATAVANLLSCACVLASSDPARYRAGLNQAAEQAPAPTGIVK